ncbi:hypothetical protein HOG17_04350 [Candidatus Peregrinibacteria bacterium]|jgi:hypothetical protein|nr:hypothetical protein [Candidatus Peregrinibacteria bacterium]MBT4148459.1 hypothetical protein [Candidatus Peregrinibacteria bacterium]MBT4366534.1 hypothetical protein [Candidatus Peregrinibacteria bacterium]MBT4456500.1 hypothetical protein [Candidatus Peregrinibacteria bacterium]
MVKEKRLVHFEQLEPTGRRKKRKSPDIFEYKVEIPKRISEHKEILQKKQDAKEAKKVLDLLEEETCPRCNSKNFKEIEEEKLQCIDCDKIWER